MAPAWLTAGSVTLVTTTKSWLFNIYEAIKHKYLCFKLEPRFRNRRMERLGRSIMLLLSSWDTRGRVYQVPTEPISFFSFFSYFQRSTQGPLVPTDLTEAEGSKWTASAINCQTTQSGQNRSGSLSEVERLLRRHLAFQGGSENRRPLRRRFVSGSRSLSYHLKLIKRKLLLLFWDRKCKQIKQRQQARLETGAKFSPPRWADVIVFKEGGTLCHRRAAAEATALQKYAAIIKSTLM